MENRRPLTRLCKILTWRQISWGRVGIDSMTVAAIPLLFCALRQTLLPFASALASALLDNSRQVAAWTARSSLSDTVEAKDSTCQQMCENTFCVLWG